MRTSLRIRLYLRGSLFTNLALLVDIARPGITLLKRMPKRETCYEWSTLPLAAFRTRLIGGWLGRADASNVLPAVNET